MWEETGEEGRYQITEQHALAVWLLCWCFFVGGGGKELLWNEAWEDVFCRPIFSFVNFSMREGGVALLVSIKA